MIHVQVTGSEAVRDKLQQLGARMAGQALAATAVEVEELVRQGAKKHHKKGALVGSIYKARTPDGWEIGHDLQRAKHALFVVFGTKAHEIRARNKQALHYVKDGVFWYWFGPKTPQERAMIMKWVRKKSGDNARVMFRWPKHPGYKGDNYLLRAAQLAPQLFAAQVQKRLDKLA